MTQYITLPKQAQDITNQRFGKLIALGPVGRIFGTMKWLCQCDCGNTTEAIIGNLRKGHTKSCGCLKAQNGITTHGMAHTKLYKVWHGMIERCEDQNNISYSKYGARGIRVCDEWRHSFEAYYAHVSTLPNFGQQGYSLDRIKNDGNYEPGNVRYATHSEQARNTRQTRMITLGDRTQSLAAWAEETQINIETLRDRLKRGWSIEQALSISPATS